MLKRNWKIFFVILSQTTDLLAIAFTRIGVMYGFDGFVDLFNPRFFVPLFTFAFVYLMVATMFGLYRGSFHLSLRLQNFILFRAFLVSVLIANTIILFSGLFYYRLSLAFFFIFLPLALLISRYALMRFNLYFQTLGYGIHETLIIGYNGEFSNLFSRFSIFPELGYHLRGYVTNNGRDSDMNVPQYSFDQVEMISDQFKIDRIFITTDLLHSLELKKIELFAKKKHIKVKIISQEAENILRIAKIYDIAGITLTAPKQKKVLFIKRITKRAFDIIFSSIIILLLSPLFIITIAAIYIESGRPIFYTQKRASIKNGNTFNVIKFRSMIKNAETLQDELLQFNETDNLFKMKNDPRVTNVGKIIRKTSIDELPQLFNVLLGDMSLVGPRPISLSDFQKMDEPDEYWDYISERAAVKPGMTGLWQVSGRSNIKFREMILLDLYYVENHSILFDLEILFETIPVVLFGKGAY